MVWGFFEITLNLNYTVALLILAVIIASYVIVGGLKG
ncbi:MAG: sodium:solute symporter family transporter [Candidatus Humimicrobiaceae bacterium]